MAILVPLMHLLQGQGLVCKIYNTNFQSLLQDGMAKTEKGVSHRFLNVIRSSNGLYFCDMFLSSLSQIATLHVQGGVYRHQDRMCAPELAAHVASSASACLPAPLGTKRCAPVMPAYGPMALSPSAHENVYL